MLCSEDSTVSDSINDNNLVNNNSRNIADNLSEVSEKIEDSCESFPASDVEFDECNVENELHNLKVKISEVDSLYVKVH